MSFETMNGLKNAPEVISEGLKIKKISGRAPTLGNGQPNLSMLGQRPNKQKSLFLAL